MPAAALHRPAADPSAPSERSARRLSRIAPLLLAPLVVLAGALSACGSSSSSGSSADPASLIPAAAPLYAAATVRPAGALKSAALADGRALTHQADPYLRLLAALQTPGSPALSFGRDVAPWLGSRAGIYLSSPASSSALSGLLAQGLLGGAGTGQFPFAAGRAEGAIVLDTSDVAKARAFLDTQAQRAGAHATSYRGVALRTGSGGVTFAIVSRLAVIGSETALHEVIDTALGAPSLARQSGYVKLLAAAPSDALAHVYAGASSASPSAGGSGGNGERRWQRQRRDRRRAGAALRRSAGEPVARSLRRRADARRGHAEERRRHCTADCSRQTPKVPPRSANCRVNRGSRSASATLRATSRQTSRRSARSPRSRVPPGRAPKRATR